MKMICLINMTDYYQRIYIFDGETQVSHYTCNGIKDFYKNIFAIANEYDITDIDFEGLNVDYLAGVRRVVKSKELMEYRKDNLNITIKEFIPDEVIEEN